MSSPSSRRSSIKPKQESRMGATSVVLPTEPKRQKMPLWIEWNEADLNAEKWEVGGKVGAKDAKAVATKPQSAQASHGFEDPDPKFDLPHNLSSRIEYWKRPSDIFDKVCVVDTDNGLESFDLMQPNEHLHCSETIRWFISQINSLWDICKKDPKALLSALSSSSGIDQESITNKAVLAGRTWRPWEHIHAINKFVKGPFIPPYNPYGKYAVRIYFMGAWRKVIIDDLIPIDESGNILLPQTLIKGEIWPMLLTKALLKVFYLDFNAPGSATEFNDANVITCLTGWTPEPIPLRYGHLNEVWKFLKTTLPNYQWPNEKPKQSIDGEEQVESGEHKDETLLVADKQNLDPKSAKKPSKMDVKGALSGKESKLDKQKKDTKVLKTKPLGDEAPQEDLFSPDFPETLIFASFCDLPLTKISAHTEMADRRENLRKYNLNNDFSNPVWITCTRDITLEPPLPPEKVPLWKTIRPRKKQNQMPSDEPIQHISPKPDHWVEIKSPYVGFKSQPSHTPAPPLVAPSSVSSKRSRNFSRPQTGIHGIQEVDERSLSSERSHSPRHTYPAKSPSRLEVSNTEKFESESMIKNKSINGDKKSVKDKKPKDVDKLNVSNSRDAAKESSSLGVPSVKPKISKDLSISSDGKYTSDEMANLSIQISSEQPNDSKIMKETELKTLEQPKGKLWMDFEDFFVCFKSLFVYHKPSCYKFNEKSSDLKQVQQHQQKQEKKKETNASQQIVLADDKIPRLLFVDSLSNIEIIVSYSSLSKWYEQRVESTQVGKKKTDIIPEHDTISIADGTKEYTPLQYGYLMAENYSWKSLVTGQPVLRIHTTATRAALLTLPPGRHVLKFMFNAPVGSVIQLLSNTKFSFGDEEDIMPKLKDESMRFVDQATSIMRSICDCVKSFGDASKQQVSFDQLNTSLSPAITESVQNNKRKYFNRRSMIDAFNGALYEMLKSSLGDQIDAECSFAWKVFANDTTNFEQISVKEKRPSTASTVRGSAKKLDKKKSELNVKGDKSDAKADKLVAEKPVLNNDKSETMSEERAEYWKNHIPTDKEIKSVIIIQSHWRGHYVRLVKKSRTPGTQENHQVAELLKKSLVTLDMNLNENALFLFRMMFKLNAQIMEFYSFFKDEWNRISYFDYNGSCADPQNSNWLILFRDIFYSNEEILLLPKLYTNLNNCILRVIDNDTYKEVPKVFNRVSPYTYNRNKKGYTIMAETKYCEQQVGPGKWRLRLIGSSPLLLTPKNAKTEISSNFILKEVRDYYVPNEKKLMLRQRITVNEDHLASLQVHTSKADVYFKLTIYDNGEEILSVNGKGIAVIPAFIFLKDKSEVGMSEYGMTSRPNSKTSNLRSSKVGNTNAKDSKAKSVASRSSSRQSLKENDDEDAIKSHKYIVEAVILRDSWPLTASQWAFVNSLKETEIAEQKVFSKDRVSSPVKQSGSAINSTPDSKGPKAKKKEAKPTKQDAVKSRPQSSQFDGTKPHWTLKIMSDTSNADDIDVRKDTERQEEIKSMKRAWEASEPGRGAKAIQARLDFLKTHLIKVDNGEEDNDKLDDASQEASLQQQLQQQQQQSTKPQDLKQQHQQPKKQAASTPAQDVKGVNKVAGKKVSEKQPLEQLVSVEQLIIEPIDEVLLNRPPTPPKPKAILPPIDMSSLIKSMKNERNFKDERLEKELAEQRKREFENYMDVRDNINRIRDEIRLNNKMEKIKQIEEAESLQLKLDEARKSVYEPRESFRQAYLEAERKRLEEIAAREALILLAASKADLKKDKKGSAGKKKK